MPQKSSSNTNRLPELSLTVNPLTNAKEEEVRIYFEPFPRVIFQSGVEEIPHQTTVHLDKKDSVTDQHKWKTTLQLVRNITEVCKQTGEQMHLLTDDLVLLRQQGEAAAKLADTVEMINSNPSTAHPGLAVKIGLHDTVSQADIIVTDSINENFLRTIRLEPQKRRRYDFENCNIQSGTIFPIFTDGRKETDIVVKEIFSIRNNLNNLFYTDIGGHPIEYLANYFLDAERICEEVGEIENPFPTLVTIPYFFTPANYQKLQGRIDHQQWSNMSNKRIEIYGKPIGRLATFVGALRSEAIIIYKFIPYEQGRNDAYHAILAAGQSSSSIILPPDLANRSSTLICPTGFESREIHGTIREIWSYYRGREKQTKTRSIYPVKILTTTAENSKYDPEQVVPLNDAILAVSREFLEPLVQHYSEVANALIGPNGVRPLKEYLALTIAARTIVPRPKFKALEDPENFAKHYSQLMEIILRWCMIDIEADDVAENADDHQKKRYMDILFEAFESYFALYLREEGSTKDKKIIVETAYQKIYEGEFGHDEKACLQYLNFSLYCIEEMMERISGLPNFKNNLARNEAFYQVIEMLKSCRFSRIYSDLIAIGNISELREKAPNLLSFLQLTAGGMGTGFMIALGAMLLKDEYVADYLQLARLIALPGRIANEFVLRKEVDLGQANAFAYLSFLVGSPEEQAQHLRVINLDAGEEKETLLNDLIEQLLHPSRIDQLLTLLQAALSDIKNILFNPDLNISSLSEGLDMFFDMELSRCPKTLQKKVKQMVKEIKQR